MKGLLARLRHDAERLAVHGDPTTALFTFFTDLVGRAAATRSVIDLLAYAGTAVPVDTPVHGLGEAIDVMLRRAQAHHPIRGDVTAADVLALLVSTTQGALRAGWTLETQRRVRCAASSHHGAPAGSDGDHARTICSFCGRRQDEIRLVAGPGVWICRRCVDLAADILRTESAAAP